MLKLFRFLKPYGWNIFGVVTFLFAQSIANLFLPTLMSDIVNNGMMSGDTGYIMRYGMYMVFVAIGSSVCSAVGSYLAAITGVSFGRDIRNQVFTQVESYSLHEFDRAGTASLITRTTNDITQVQNVLVMGMRFLVFAPIMCVGGVIMAYRQGPASDPDPAGNPSVHAHFHGDLRRSDRPHVQLDADLAGQGEPGAAREPDRHQGDPGIQPAAERERPFRSGQPRPDRGLDQGEPDHGGDSADHDVDPELHHCRHHLVRRPARRPEPDADRRHDGFLAVCHDDHVLHHHGDHHVHHDPQGAGLGRAHQRGAGPEAGDCRSGIRQEARRP